jgi:hypothetical protein
VRIPHHPGRRSALMADSIPLRWWTPFHVEGGQRSILIADTGAVF